MHFKWTSIIKKYFATSFLFLFSIVILSGCGKKSVEPVTVKPVEVVVATLESKTIPIYGEYISITKPSLHVEVRARVSGFLSERLFVDGSYVEKGQHLYSLDARPYEVELISAQAAHSHAQSSLDKVQRDLKRLTPLFEADAVSQLDMDNASAAVDSAVADLKAAEAKLEKAKLDIDYTQIKAPSNGLISELGIDVGALVGETGTFKVRASVQNNDKELLPGQYTKAKIVLEKRADTLLLPEQAVRFEQSGSLVYVVLPNNKIEQRLVFLGHNKDGFFIVESGLSNGETVVIEGTHKIRHGSPVIPMTKEQVEERFKQEQKQDQDPQHSKQQEH